MEQITPEQLEEHISHAISLSKRWNPDPKKDDSIGYSRSERVFAYLAEQLAQMHALLLWEITADIRKKVMANLGFYSTVVGRVAQLEGASKPSAYSGYETDAGNQVDIFLKRIGYPISE